MKTFKQFIAQKNDVPDVIKSLQGIAHDPSKNIDPKAFTGGVVNKLLNKMDTKSINIPSGEEITSKVSDMTSKLQTKLEDPNTSKKLNKALNLLTTFGQKK